VIPSSPGDVSVTPIDPFTLQPGQTYWVVLTTLTGTGIGWSGSRSPITPTGIATSAGYRRSPFDPPTSPIRPLPDGDTFQGTYSVQGTPLATAAPEPASLTLLGIGGLCSLGYGWRRRKRAVA